MANDLEREKSIVRHFFQKSAQVISHARISNDKESIRDRETRGDGDRWFNLRTVVNKRIDQSLAPCLQSLAAQDPLTVCSVYVYFQPDGGATTTAGSGTSATSTASEAGGSVGRKLLEVWTVQHQQLPAGQAASGPGKTIPGSYKEAVLMIRMLYTFARMLPAFRLYKQCTKHKLSPSQVSVSVHCSNGSILGSDPFFYQQQQLPHSTSSAATTTSSNFSFESKSKGWEFGVVNLFHGQLKLSVQYQETCDYSLLPSSSEPVLITDYNPADASSGPVSIPGSAGSRKSSNAPAYAVYPYSSPSTSAPTSSMMGYLPGTTPPFATSASSVAGQSRSPPIGIPGFPSTSPVGPFPGSHTSSSLQTSGRSLSRSTSKSGIQPALSTSPRHSFKLSISPYQSTGLAHFPSMDPTGDGPVPFTAADDREKELQQEMSVLQALSSSASAFASDSGGGGGGGGGVFAVEDDGLFSLDAGADVDGKIGQFVRSCQEVNPRLFTSDGQATTTPQSLLQQLDQFEQFDTSLNEF